MDVVILINEILSYLILSYGTERVKDGFCLVWVEEEEMFVRIVVKYPPLQPAFLNCYI
jgi:hypothetical protein